MRIDLQIPAHLDKEVAADLLLSTLEGGEFSSEIHTAMAPFPSSATNAQSTFFRRASRRSRRSNSAPFTMLWSDSSVRVSSAGRGGAVSADRGVKRCRHSQAGSGNPLEGRSQSSHSLSHIGGSGVFRPSEVKPP